MKPRDAERVRRLRQDGFQYVQLLPPLSDNAEPIAIVSRRTRTEAVRRVFSPYNFTAYGADVTRQRARQMEGIYQCTD